MRIELRDDGQFDAQTHAYAEYRVFATVAPLGNLVRQVTVTLAPADPSGAHPVSGERVVCTVSIVTGPGHRAEVRAKGRHPYEAIDSAAGRIRKILIPWTSASAETKADDETPLNRESA